MKILDAKIDLWSFFVNFLSEFVGTALLMFLGCMGCIQSTVFPNTLLQMALNFGLAVYVVVQAFVSVSGAHINPAVTLAAFIYGKISLVLSLVFFVAQVLGALVGYSLLMLLIPNSTTRSVGAAHNLCITAPYDEVKWWQAFIIEIIITTVLIWVLCSIWDPRNYVHIHTVSLRMGLAIVCLCCSAGGLTGASMNPARSLAPAIYNSDYYMLWIYWTGPFLGAIIAAISYLFIFSQGPEMISTENEID